MKRFDKYKRRKSSIAAQIPRTILLLFPILACAENVTYSYDNLNRLTRTDFGNGRAIEYTYDAAGNRLSHVVTAPNQIPIANAGPDRTVECGGPNGTKVTLDGSGSTDPDDDKLSFAWTGPFGKATGMTPTVKLPMGANTNTLSVNDGKGGRSSDVGVITVEDTMAPKIQGLTAIPSMLKPPNHKMVAVKISASAIDICDKAPICKIITVASNEAISGLDKDDLAPDWQITGNVTVNLRAERSATGTGRVYTLAVQCRDATGNSEAKSVSVRVSIK